MVQVEGNTPNIVSGNSYNLLELLPLCCEGNTAATKCIMRGIIRRFLMVELTHRIHHL